MKSRTLIDKQLRKKTNSELSEIIIKAKKKKNWVAVAGKLSAPRRARLEMNLSEISKKIGDEKKVLVPGKVLSQGDLTKKAEIIAFKFSEKAKEKILKAGGKTISILEEIKSNPDAKGIKILE